jgi:hypothetical protein
VSGVTVPAKIREVTLDPPRTAFKEGEEKTAFEAAPAETFR